MKKIICILCLLMMFIIVGCENNKLPDPNTNLEFWIGENVDSIDLSKYQVKHGMFGGVQFYGTNYIPTVDPNKNQIDPSECVLYTITSYPDYSDKEQHITSIYITDPNIYFYNISLNTSITDFKNVMENLGFEVDTITDNYCKVKYGKYTIAISKECIIINFNVENKEGIIF